MVLNFRFIVARYNEDISWTKDFPNVTLINKGEKLEETFGHTVIELENVGREGHSYYKWIYDNYENILEDYIIFVQGNPFDHSPNILTNLHKYMNDSNLNNDFIYISQLHNKTTLLKECDKKLYCTTILRTYQDLFRFIKESEIVGAWGAQFMVSKRSILTKSKAFYEKLVNLVGHSINPDEGYHFERLHHEIMSYNEYTKTFENIGWTYTEPKSK